MFTSKHICFYPYSLLLVALCLNTVNAATTNAVTVYRCTDAKGNVSIQDVACAPSNSQQVSKMFKPKDTVAPKPAIPPTSPTTQIIFSAPEPINYPKRPAPDLYQCTDFEGKVRESEFYDPRPRCVPLWVQGYQSPTHACSWVEDACYRYEGKQLCERWIAKQKQAVLNADRPSAENTDFKKAEAARLTQIVKDSCQ